VNPPRGDLRSSARTRLARLAALLAAAAWTAGGAAAASAVAPTPPAPVAPGAGIDRLDTHRIDAAFARYDREGSPGCAAGLVAGGRLAWARGYGLASLEQQVPNRPSTVFDLGSTSKQVTAAAVALLALDGRLALDDDVRKYVPELPDHGARITLRHLLTHTSGLRDYTDLLSFEGRREEDVTTVADALGAMARQRGVNFAPGAEFRYCNTGFFLASVVVERVSGKSLRAFAAERLFGPLGMTHTTYMDDHALVVPGRATGYAPRDGGGFRVEMSDWEQTGDGAVQSSVEDMALWASALDAGTAGGPGVARLLQEPGRLADGTPIDYGLGLFLDQHRGLRLVQHGGAWAGFRAMLARVPERGLAAVTLCNVASADTGTLALAVLDAALDAGPAPPPPPPAPVAADAAVLVPLAGTYVNEHLGEVAKVLTAGGTLRVDGLGLDGDLVAEGAGRFRSKGERLAIEFEPGGAALRVRAPGYGPRPARFDRVAAAAKPGPQVLADFTGSYVSAETGPPWLVRLAAGTLRLVLPAGDTAELEPLSDDLFSAEWGLVRFRRDATGRVTALSFTDRGLVDLTLRRAS
jgi:CubicO group peptidase (beta-lactamase class C family)